MAINPTYLPTGEKGRLHKFKDRSASRGNTPEEKEHRRLAKKVRKLKNK